MKICLINNLYKPLDRGGAERIVELSAKGFIDDGNEVFVISSKPKDYNGEEIIKAEKVYRLDSNYFNLHKIPLFFRLFWHVIDIFDLSSYFSVKKILEEEKPDLVITHNLKGIGYLIPILIKKIGIKHIHVLHDIQLIHPSGLLYYKEERKVRGFFSLIYSKICSVLFKYPDIVVSPSRWLLKMHIDYGFFKNSKKIVIPNPVNFEDLETQKIKNNSGVLNFLYVGQIEKHKGVFLLVDAFKSVLNKGFSAVLTIVGSGTGEDILHKMIKDENDIIFLGKKNSDEVMSLMQGSYCLVVPSLCYENSPTVIYEAAFNNLFVLSSNLGGAPELLEHFRGESFSPEKNELENKLIDAIKNPEKLYSNSGDLKKFSSAKNLDAYIKAIYNLLV